MADWQKAHRKANAEKYTQMEKARWAKKHPKPPIPEWHVKMLEEIKTGLWEEFGIRYEPESE